MIELNYEYVDGHLIISTEFELSLLPPLSTSNGGVLRYVPDDNELNEDSYKLQKND